MSLINCPECNNSISDTAFYCPQCGMNLKEIKRGFWGILFKWAFILFNLLMIAITFKSCSSVANLMDADNDQYSQIGYTLGFSIGMGALLIFWATVDIILGLCVIITRPNESHLTIKHKKQNYSLPSSTPKPSSSTEESDSASTWIVILTVLGMAFFYFLGSNRVSSSSSQSIFQTYEETSKPKECSYLKDLGVKTGVYYNIEEMEFNAAQKSGIPYEKDENAEYACISDYTTVGHSSNQVAYYAYGNSNKIERVVLAIGINDLSDKNASLEKFSELSSHLYQEYTGTPLSQKYIKKINQQLPFNTQSGTHSISLKKSGHKKYNLTFEIK